MCPPWKFWAAVQVPWNLINEYSSSWVISPIEISSPSLIRSPFILTSNKAFQAHYSCSTHQLRPFACHFIWKMGDACAHDSASARYLELHIYNPQQQKKQKRPYKIYKNHSKCIFKKKLNTFHFLQKKNTKCLSPAKVDVPIPPFQLTVQRPTALDTFGTVPPTWRLFDHHKGLEHLGSSHHPPNVGSSSAENQGELRRLD